MTEKNNNKATGEPIIRTRYYDDSFKGVLREFYEACKLIKNDGLMGKIILIGGSFVVAACTYMAVSGGLKEVRNKFIPDVPKEELIQGHTDKIKLKSTISHFAAHKSRGVS